MSAIIYLTTSIHRSPAPAATLNRDTLCLAFLNFAVRNVCGESVRDFNGVCHRPELTLLPLACAI